MFLLQDNGRIVWDGDTSVTLDVLRPYNEQYKRSMGQRLHLSFIDAHALNQLYCTGEVFHQQCVLGNLVNEKLLYELENWAKKN